MTTAAGSTGPGERSTLAVLLRAWRERALLTQEQLAERTGLGTRTIRRLEAGAPRRPRSESVRLLAEALELVETERAQLIAAARARAGQHLAGRPGPAGQPDRAPVPRQLPADVAGFAGRNQQLRELDALLAGCGGGGGPAAVVISAIAGTAGVGKTALAVHWAHRAAGQFPDGQLYANLRGFDSRATPTEPAAVLHGFLPALGVPSPRIPADLDAQAALFRSVLADRQTLVVLDNARDADQVRPLLPGSPGCLALVTSRNQLTGLVAQEGARPLQLDLLSAAESRQLLATRLGADRVGAEPDAVEEIILGCAQLPLALAIAAARAATHPGLPLRALAAELRDSRDRLGALAGGDPASDLRSVFSCSYRTLTPAAARLFRLMGLAPGPDLSAAAAASLAGLPTREVGPLLLELSRAHLIIEHAPGRYAFHDLLRAYATGQAQRIDPDRQRRAAAGRVLDHYLHTAGTAAAWLDRHRDPITPPPARPGVTPERPADRGQALSWFTAEHQVLRAAVEHSARTGLGRHAWQLSWTLATYLDAQGHWHDWAATCRTALTAARRAGSRPAQLRCHRMLAHAYIGLRQLDDAHQQLHCGLELARRGGDPAGQAHIHVSLARVCEQRGRPAEALEHVQHARELYDAAGHQRGQANALGNLGWLHVQLGDYRRALSYCHQSMELHCEIGDAIGVAAAWDSLGYAHHHLGDHARAISCYLDAAAQFRELGDRFNEADTLTRLGETQHAAGDPDAARSNWRRALTILAELGHPEAGPLGARIGSLDQRPALGRSGDSAAAPSR